jgi:hypothetical protein
MEGTAILIAVALGVLLGATSSVVTRRMGVRQGVAVAVTFCLVALLLLTVVDLGTVLTAMLAFSVTAAIFDPRSGAKNRPTTS